MAKSRKFTPEQDSWLIKYFSTDTISVITKKYNHKFGTNIASKNLLDHCKRYLKLKGNKNHFFTLQQDEWLRENYPLYLASETTKMFNEIFHTRKIVSLLRSMQAILILKLVELIILTRNLIGSRKIGSNQVLFLSYMKNIN